MFRLILLFFVAIGGFWMGKAPTKSYTTEAGIHPEKDFPLVEHKSFAIVIYGYNQALWCERALKATFEQDFDHYRVIFIDDGSTDGTDAIVSRFVLDNHQEGKVILMRNQERLGRSASIHRAVSSCMDREIVIALDANNWLISPKVLGQLDGVYQNPDVWVASGKTLEYPSYEVGEAAQISFYAALLKGSNMETFDELRVVSGGRVRKMEEPISFINCTYHPRH